MIENLFFDVVYDIGNGQWDLCHTHNHTIKLELSWLYKFILILTVKSSANGMKKYGYTSTKSHIDFISSIRNYIILRPRS